MTLSLYDAFVPACARTLTGMSGLIETAEKHCKEHNLAPSELIEARLADGMWNLPWHVRACWVHSAYTLDLLPSGEFTPDFTDVPADFAAMRAMVDDAQTKLAAVNPADVNALSEQTIGFVLGGKRLMEMTGQNFLLAFNQPNFYFHATTFYGILRMKGLPLGKRDFMGPPPVLGA